MNSNLDHYQSVLDQHSHDLRREADAQRKLAERQFGRPTTYQPQRAGALAMLASIVHKVFHRRSKPERGEEAEPVLRIT